MMYNFPYDKSSNKNLIELGKELCNDLINNAARKAQFYETTGKREQLIFSASKSKDIMNKIDNQLAEHYGFTEAELDFIINYDIKYRMGKALFGEAEDDNEED